MNLLPTFIILKDNKTLETLKKSNIKKAFWEQYLDNTVQKLKKIVYKLFGLTDEEIEIVEKS